MLHPLYSCLLLGAAMISVTQQRDLPREITEIIKHGLRNSTKKSYTPIHWKWILFAQSKGFSPYSPTVKHVLMFLHWLHKTTLASPWQLARIRGAIKWVVNTSFHVVVDSVLVSRYLAGLFNLFLKPPPPYRDVWDVNLVLKYWDSAPPNKDLQLMLLSCKTIILLLISTMRHRCDVLAMTKYFYSEPNAYIFPLDTYPKNFNIYLQSEDFRYIVVRKFSENLQICPLTTLQYYLKRTALVRTTNKLFVTTQSPFRAAAPMTVRRWILSALDIAGIDVMRYSASTTWHASSSKAFYAGVQVGIMFRLL